MGRIIMIIELHVSTDSGMVERICIYVTIKWLFL